MDISEKMPAKNNRNNKKLGTLEKNTVPYIIKE